jgi:hypothetical protein
MNKKYTIDKLKDYSRISDIYKLTHDTCVEAGVILPKEDGQLITFPHLDYTPQTTILIAEQDGQIIGTNSFKIDGSEGLHTDIYFREETDKIREKVTGVLGCSWRIATHKEYRKERSLILDMIKRTFEVALTANCEVCLFIFSEKHSRIYQRIIGAEIVSKKNFSLDNNIETMGVMMQVEIQKGWNKFQPISAGTPHGDPIRPVASLPPQ